MIERPSSCACGDHPFVSVEVYCCATLLALHAGAPEVMTGERYNESADTFSFALVLLCLAVGDIGFLRKRWKQVSSASYARGWRPPLPSKLRTGCPDLASLISEMWDGDFRKRPALKDVIPRLEATASADLDKVRLPMPAATTSADLSGTSPRADGRTSGEDGETLSSLESDKDAVIEALQERGRADRLEIANLTAALLAAGGTPD